MKKRVTVFACILCISTLLSGCSLPEPVAAVLPDKLVQGIEFVANKGLETGKSFMKRVNLNPDVVNKTIESTTASKNAVFRIGDQECMPEDARVILLSYQNQYSSIYGVDLWKHDYGDGQSLESYVKDLALSQLAQVYTLDVIAEKEEITLTETERNAAKSAAEFFFEGLTDSEKQYLNVDQARVQTLYEKYALAQKMYKKFTENVDMEVSDDEARVQELRVIYMSDYSAAQQVHQMLDTGSSFASLADTYSETEETTVYVSRQDFEDEKIADAVFSLMEGDYTNLIQVNNGYYMYQCAKYYDQERTDAHKSAVTQAHLDEYMKGVYDQYGSLLDSKENENVWDSMTIDKNVELSGTSFAAIFDKYF